MSIYGVEEEAEVKSNIRETISLGMYRTFSKIDHIIVCKPSLNKQ